MAASSIRSQRARFGLVASSSASGPCSGAPRASHAASDPPSAPSSPVPSHSPRSVAESPGTPRASTWQHPPFAPAPRPRAGSAPAAGGRTAALPRRARAGRPRRSCRELSGGGRPGASAPTAGGLQRAGSPAMGTDQEGDMSTGEKNKTAGNDSIPSD